MDAKTSHVLCEMSISVLLDPVLATFLLLVLLLVDCLVNYAF
jgi:hypothetical protein